MTDKPNREEILRMAGDMGRAAREYHKKLAAECGLTPEQEQEIVTEGTKLIRYGIVRVWHGG